MPDNRIPVDEARRLCEIVFAETMGAPRDVTAAATDVLVDADLRGISSHGIAVLPYYLDKWQQGQIVPDARPELVSETGTTRVFAGHRAIGHFTSRQAMDTAIEKARSAGLGSAVVRNSTHNGAISAYTIQAARAGLLGIAATACAPHVAPPGGRHGLHGTNPFSYALPRPNADPLVFDSGLQAMIVWTSDRLGELSLPSRFTRYRQFVSSFPSEGARIVIDVHERTNGKVVSDIDWIGEDGNLLARLEGYESVVDSGLSKAFRHNRLHESAPTRA